MKGVHASRTDAYSGVNRRTQVYQQAPATGATVNASTSPTNSASLDTNGLMRSVVSLLGDIVKTLPSLIGRGQSQGSLQAGQPGQPRASVNGSSGDASGGQMGLFFPFTSSVPFDGSSFGQPQAFVDGSPFGNVPMGNIMNGGAGISPQVFNFNFGGGGFGVPTQSAIPNGFAPTPFTGQSAIPNGSADSFSSGGSGQIFNFNVGGFGGNFGSSFPPAMMPNNQFASPFPSNAMVNSDGGDVRSFSRRGRRSQSSGGQLGGQQIFNFNFGGSGFSQPSSQTMQAIPNGTPQSFSFAPNFASQMSGFMPQQMGMTTPQMFGTGQSFGFSPQMFSGFAPQQMAMTTPQMFGSGQSFSFSPQGFGFPTQSQSFFQPSFGQPSFGQSFSQGFSPQMFSFPQQSFGFPQQQSFGFPQQQSFSFAPQQSFGFPQQQSFGLPTQSFGAQSFNPFSMGQSFGTTTVAPQFALGNQGFGGTPFSGSAAGIPTVMTASGPRYVIV